MKGFLVCEGCRARVTYGSSGERGIEDTPRPPDMLKDSQLSIGRKGMADEGKNTPAVAHSFGDDSHGYAVRHVMVASPEPTYCYNHRVHKSPAWC